MFNRFAISRFLAPVAATLMGWACLAAPAWAGSALLRNSAVGGVSIGVDGVLVDTPPEVLLQTRTSWEEFLQGAPANMQGATEIRKVSLRGLEQALTQAVRTRAGEIPEEIQFLGGIQRIQYVLVYPPTDNQPGDIVLAGPGEGWKVDQHGAVVGVTTGLPVLRLDDLMVALRSVKQAREGGVNCSINPTPEGVERMQRLIRQTARFTPDFAKAIEQAGGQQVISVEGIPDTSRFARVMVAADYRMKRIAMQLEPSPVKELPSYLEMLQQSRGRISGAAQPRWWLACSYQPLARSEDGLAWQLRGPGVKVLTEENLVEADGTLTAAGDRAADNPLAQRWADQMTKVYDTLAQREPIFADLRNLMDLSVVAALIEKEGLRTKAGLESLPSLLRDIPPDSYHAPKSLSTKCTIVKRGNGYVFMASGGVQVDSWQAASESQVDAAVAPVHQQARPASGTQNWCWN